MVNAIITDPEVFMENLGIDDLNDPKAHRDVGDVHRYLVQNMGVEITLDRFLSEIGTIMEGWGNGAFKPRKKHDKLYSDSGKGLDSLSVFLNSNVPGMTGAKYREIIAYSHNGFLDHFYKIFADSLDPVSD